MYRGSKIYLNAINKEDLPQLMNWRNLPEYRKHFREYRELNMDMQMQLLQVVQRLQLMS